MKQCKRDGCDNVVEGKAVWCGDACRKKSSRIQVGHNDKSDTIKSDIPKSDTQVGHITPATLDDYHDPDGRNYAARTNPELLNWDKPMTLSQLNSAGLKANRVSIPGDWDYSGIGKQAGDKTVVTGVDVQSG